MMRGWFLYGALIVAGGSAAAGAADQPFADTVLRNGYVFTVDANATVAEAIAVKDGHILYVGSNSGTDALVGPKTQVTDLKGHMVMPGLVDGHMHPDAGGQQLTTCNLDYAPLTRRQFQARIQACLDADPGAPPDKWLMVSNWYRQFMRPPGADATKATLDALKTKRPIVVSSSDGHSQVVNSRGLKLAGIAAKTPDPVGGSIAHDARHQPTGILEDEAGSLVLRAIPPAKPEDLVTAASAALDAMRRQGVTTFLDAMATPDTMTAYTTLQKAGKLTARAHFAPLVNPVKAASPDEVVSWLKGLAAQFDQGAVGAAPTVTVRNAKIFMDGVLQAPAQTAGTLAPYLVDKGSKGHPDWQPGAHSGEVYFPEDILDPLLIALGNAGFEPHIHAIGDRSVRVALNGYEQMRKALPGLDIRAAIAHAELVDPADYSRFKTLDVTPVMSFQWAKRGPDSIDGAMNQLGPARFAHMEPEGSLAAAGTRIAYGSDWPVDRLDEWFALKVGVTRTGDGKLGKAYDGPFNDDKGLSPAEVLRAITLNSSYELHQDKETGSLEPGKLADLIVLDRNPLRVPPDEIAKTTVLVTMVGGQIVYRGGDF
jgi:predicted amidohydrolase YtcJ